MQTLTVKSICIILTVLSWLSFCRAESSFTPDSLQDRLISRALSRVYLDSFPAALSCLDSLLAKTPRYWPAKVISAGVIYMDMADNEDYARQTYCMRLIDSSMTALENHLDTFPKDAWAQFFMGTALGYRAVWEGQHGSLLKAISHGLKAGKYFARTAKIDSTLYDAYFGLGNLHYWRSAKLGILRSLPFIADQRRQGIDELTLALNKSRYSGITAALSLGWIYIDRKEYDKAKALSDSLISVGISGRQILWLKATACFSLSDAEGTIAAFETIKEGLLRKGRQNYYNLITCGYYLGLANYINGNRQAALKHFDEILGYKPSLYIAKRSAKKLESARGYQKKIAANGG